MSATLSIDWEDFGQLYGMYHGHGITEPADGNIERQTHIILDMLDEAGVKATFFVLGMLAAYRPDLVREMHARGHEVGLHGHRHVMMSGLSREEAREDLRAACRTVADIIGSKVYGYRAPFFSIDRSNLYLLEHMAEEDLSYDSSIFPMRTGRYGIAGFDENDRLYALPNGLQLVELPLTVGRYLGRQWPVSGGGYVRLMPGPLVDKVFCSLAAAGKPSMIYMHPYEFDSRQIDVATNYPPGTNRATVRVRFLNFRWNLFRGSVRGKIARLLREHAFITCQERASHVEKAGIRTELLG